MSETNDRREFLNKSLAAGAALGLAGLANAEEEKSDKGLPTRELGKTGEKVSLLCLGGWYGRGGERRRGVPVSRPVTARTPAV